MIEISKYIIISLLVILSTGSCEKNDAPEMTESESIERADEVLRDYADFVRSKEFIRVDIKSSSEVGSTTNGIDMTSNYGLAVAKPDRFSFILGSGLTGTSMVLNRNRVQIWHKPHRPADLILGDLTPDIGSPFDERVIGRRNAVLIRMVFLWRSIVERNPDEYIKKTFHDVRYKGLRELDGVKCHCVGMVFEDFNFDVYFDTGETRVLRKAVGIFEDNTNGSSMSVISTFNNWRFDKIDDSEFAIPSPHAPAAELNDAKTNEKNDSA